MEKMDRKVISVIPLWRPKDYIYTQDKEDPDIYYVTYAPAPIKPLILHAMSMRPISCTCRDWRTLSRKNPYVRCQHMDRFIWWKIEQLQKAEEEAKRPKIRLEIIGIIHEADPA